jgi:anti-sigma B factor antagonist
MAAVKSVFEVTASREGDVATVVVTGDVDSETVGELIEACDAQLIAGTTALRLDLAETAFVDSSGLVVLLDLRAAAAERDIALRLLRPSQAVQRVLELSELVRVFDVER